MGVRFYEYYSVAFAYYCDWHIWKDFFIETITCSIDADLKITVVKSFPSPLFLDAV